MTNVLPSQPSLQPNTYHFHFLFSYRVSYIPSGPQTYCADETGFELLILPQVLSTCQACRSRALYSVWVVLGITSSVCLCWGSIVPTELHTQLSYTAVNCKLNQCPNIELRFVFLFILRVSYSLGGRMESQKQGSLEKSCLNSSYSLQCFSICL